MDSLLHPPNFSFCNFSNHSAVRYCLCCYYNCHFPDCTFIKTYGSIRKSWCKIDFLNFFIVADCRKARKMCIFNKFSFCDFLSFSVRGWQMGGKFSDKRWYNISPADGYLPEFLLINITERARDIHVPSSFGSITVSSDISLRQIHSTYRQSGYSSILTCRLPWWYRRHPPDFLSSGVATS